jgi:general secretion pathway protein G
MKQGKRNGIILLAIATIALLALGTLSRLITTVGGHHAPHLAVTAVIYSIDAELRQYKAMNGFYPTTDQGLQALVTQPATEPRPSHWRQAFREYPWDPWRNKFVYRCPGIKNPDTYDLFSAGPDGIADTADDDWGP